MSSLINCRSISVLVLLLIRCPPADDCLEASVWCDLKNNNALTPRYYAYRPPMGGTASKDVVSCVASQATFGAQIVMAPSGWQDIFHPTASRITKRKLSESMIKTSFVCLRAGDALYWDVSHPSRAEYPVYLENNILNTHSDFDFFAFRELGHTMRTSNLTIDSFTFVFSQPGIFIFSSANFSHFGTVHVVPAGDRCEDWHALAVPEKESWRVRGKEVELRPDWELLGSVFTGPFLLTAAGLWYHRRRNDRMHEPTDHAY